MCVWWHEINKIKKCLNFLFFKRARNIKCLHSRKSVNSVSPFLEEDETLEADKPNAQYAMYIESFMMYYVITIM